MNRCSLRFLLVLFCMTANTLSVFAQSDIWNCSKCGKRVWDSDSGRPRPTACPYCSGGGTGGGMTGLPTPRNSTEMGQYIAGSMMLGIIQGIEQGTAAQQEAARRAAEEAAAAERRRQERLRKAAEEARVNWQVQDEANLREFGMIVSSKKKGSGLPPLLAKQAAQATPVFGDSNAPDPRAETNLASQVSGGTSMPTVNPPVPPSPATTLQGVPPAPPPRVVAKSAPARLLPLPPPARTLPPKERIPPEVVEFIKDGAKDAAFDTALELIRLGSAAESVVKQAKRTLEFGNNLTEASRDHLNELFGIVEEAVRPGSDWVALSAQADNLLHSFGAKIISISKKAARSEITDRSENASMAAGVFDAAEINAADWRHQGASRESSGVSP